MLDLANLPTGLAVLRWTAELPPAGPSDPLGLTLRMGARLSAELLHCITSITPRARYYSFFPWAFRRAAERVGDARSTDEVLKLVLLDERAMVLGAVLHHGGLPCHGGGLAGSSKAQTVATDPQVRSIDLSKWIHLDSPTGAFAAYKGSLINLGLFAQSESAGPFVEPEAEDPKLANTDLSPAGDRLAQAFDIAVSNTDYVIERPDKGSVSLTPLVAFGAAAGLCELRAAADADLQPLRELFFAKDVEGQENSHFRRRMSLLLIMSGIDAADGLGLRLSAEAFDDFTFYGRFATEVGAEALPRSPLPEPLDDIAERWRVYHFHNYLTLALQSCLAGIVRAVREQPAGMTLSEVLGTLNGPAAQSSLADFLTLTEASSFFDLTPAESLALVGCDIFPLLDGDESALERFRSGPMIERNLQTLLVEGGAAQASAGTAIATILLYALLLRHELTLDEKYKGWTRAKVDNPFTDVALPTIWDTLRTYFGADWWLAPNRDILLRVLWRFVVMQHQAMSYERGFGGSAPLFHVDGQAIIGTDLGLEEVFALNARFPSAVQILEDLALVEKDPERICLTSAGKAWLEQSLAESS